MSAWPSSNPRMGCARGRPSGTRSTKSRRSTSSTSEAAGGAGAFGPFLAASLRMPAMRRSSPPSRRAGHSSDATIRLMTMYQTHSSRSRGGLRAARRRGTAGEKGIGPSRRRDGMAASPRLGSRPPCPGGQAGGRAATTGGRSGADAWGFPSALRRVIEPPAGPRPGGDAEEHGPGTASQGIERGRMNSCVGLGRGRGPRRDRGSAGRRGLRAAARAGGRRGRPRRRPRPGRRCPRGPSGPRSGGPRAARPQGRRAPGSPGGRTG